MIGPTPTPMTVLDPYIQMAYVAESLVIGQAFAKAMGYSKEAPLVFSFRWCRLAKRLLSSWLNPDRLFMQHLTAADDEKKSHVFLPINTAPSAIYQYVYEATKPLFRVFGGYEFPEDKVEQIVNQFLSRKG